jgi:SAM-dependent methyltransferase
MQGAENVGLDAPTRRSYFVWFLLPGFASVQLLAVTNHLCQNVAVVPFLWIAPLTLYLLSFIICFDRESWYLRRFFGFGACLCILSATYLALSGYMADFWERLGFGERGWLLTHNVLIEISVYLALLFSVCMVCHGELVRRKPPAQRLTAFYLTISAGGAVGGLLVAVVCPLVFSSYVELHLALIAGFVLAASVVLWDLTAGGFTGRSRLVPGTLVTAMTLLLGVVAWGQWQIWDHERGLTRVRDFYGVLSVKERFPNDPDLHGLALYHGNTLHGFDHLAEAKRGMPTSYYTEGSGVGRTFAALRQRGPLRVGLVGLGAGTLAAYGQAGDYFRFYEIDPQVVALAKKYFTFLTRSPAKVDIVLGDARLSLEREEPQQFDVLVLDAFSGDTIPVHLLTAEAFEIYFRHLKPDGVIAAHISSRYVDLTPVIKSVERHFRYPAVVMSVMEQKGNSVAPSVWALLTRNLLFLQHDVIQSVADTVPGDEVPLWTDQRNNLFQILRTRRAGIVSAP